ncbi:MAG: gamma-glutamyl-gamma-aminobutyrate hydrolase family protein [Rhodospirillales bacterium]|jgi:putative glutamine amidotransferase
MKKPLIGITVDAEETGGYSSLPWYALRQNYASAVTNAGGLPILLPHEVSLVDEYIKKIDGLLITGGAFDVDPALFGESVQHSAVTLKRERTEFELAITQGALARNIPVLGICGGQQLLHVVLGGTLYQHVPDEAPSNIEHEQKNPRTEPGHEVSVAANTLLARITQMARFPVNSAHHQAVKNCPEGVVISAHADDGLIEAIEAPAYKFCIGVQWHPEYSISQADDAILQAFVEASR